MSKRLPRGLERHDASSLTAARALELYHRDQLLWIRLDDEATTEKVRELAFHTT